MSRAVALLLLAAVAAGLAVQPDWRQDEMALRDSLSRVHPRIRASWLRERGLDDSYYTTVRKPDSQGLREVGRWSFGPSYDVDGRVTPTETLVALARGSGVSLLRFSRQDSLSIELLSDINAPGLLNRVWMRDTLLYVGSRAGLETYDISDERNPARLSWIQTALNDFDVQDSLAYVIGADDSFKVYNVSDPASPVFRGACQDSGYDISVCNGYAYIGDRWGLYVIDARNPASPNRVASWGSCIQGVRARGNICCATTDNPNNPGELRFTILDVRTPSSPTPLGSLEGAGGYDTQFDDTLAYISGYYTGGHEFQILGTGDSLHPHLIGQASTLGDNWGVWGDRRTGRALVADAAEGLQVFDITVPGNPALDTTVLAAGSSHDVAVRGDLMAVANEWCGMKLIGIADPTRPVEVSSIDSFYEFPATHAVALWDSFAFMGFDLSPYLRSIWIGDSSRPQIVGGCVGVQTLPEDMVLRDTLLHIVGRLRFNIVNVARPREPVLVGSCVAGDLTRAGLVVRDTLAYFIGPFDGLEIFSVTNPTAPYLVNTIAQIRAAGCDVIDTLLYVGDYDDSLHIWSFANPLAPYQLSSVYAVRSGYGVAVLGRYAYVGCDSRVRVFDVLDPRNPVEVGSCATPYEIRRVEAGNGYVYACCWEAGVSIFDTFQSGVENRASPPFKSSALVVSSPVAGDAVSLEFRAKSGSAVCVTITDAVGRVLLRDRPVVVPGSGIYRHQMNVGSLPAGVYIINVRVGLETRLTRFVKLRRR